MIDQEKVGSFIMQIRKQKGFTQKELAEKLNLSDKTISKWETGHGMPEVSIIPELCKVLGISANELLAGEELGNDESFTRKAEENIMELMRTNENVEKRSRWSLFGGLATLIILVAYIILFTGGPSSDFALLAFMDFPSILIVAGLCMTILIISGSFKDFFVGIVKCFKKKEISNEEAAGYIRAMNIALWANICAGGLGTVTEMVFVFGRAPEPAVIGPNVAVALVALFYAILFDMIILAFRGRLETLYSVR